MESTAYYKQYARNGVSALDACCACGTGNSPPPFITALFLALSQHYSMNPLILRLDFNKTAASASATRPPLPSVLCPLPAALRPPPSASVYSHMSNQ